MDYINVTPLVTPNINWAQFAPYEPSRPSLAEISWHTRLARSKDDPFDLFDSGTGAYAPTALADSRVEKVSPSASVVSEFAVKPNLGASISGADAEIDRIANQRVKLMAAKYASSAVSAEIVARLEILNQRLLERAPRVSKDQVDALENANEKLVHIRAAREARSKRLGITA